MIDQTPHHPAIAPAEAASAPDSDESTLRALLRQQRDLYPAMRGDDCPEAVHAEYRRLAAAITALKMRLGLVRFYQIKAEVNR